MNKSVSHKLKTALLMRGKKKIAVLEEQKSFLRPSEEVGQPKNTCKNKKD